MADYAQVERFEGTYKPLGIQVKPKRVWGSHRFTDEEVVALLEGETIEFDATSKTGKPYVARGRLEENEYNGFKYWGFQLDQNFVPSSYLGHTFTPEEIAALEAGCLLRVHDFVSKKTGKRFEAAVTWSETGPGSGKKALKLSFDR